MLDENKKVIKGISTEIDGENTEILINAQYWGNYEIKDIKTIDGHSIFKSSDEDSSNIILHTNSIIEKTYSELKKLIENSELIPGIHYKITDYVTTTTQENTESAGKQFDVIVIADSYNTLSESARVSLHKDDTYFSNSNLDAWEIKYCFDNDTNRFAWADSTNGKGVIYYMKDEFNNECWYDFKNIKYNIESYQTRPTGYNYAYTFTDSLSQDVSDLSLTQKVKNNKVNKFTNEDGVQMLNATVFCTEDIHDNILDEDNYNNFIFASSFYCNNIGYSFKNNYISSNNSFNENKIGNSLSDCIFKDLFEFNNMCDDYYNNEFNYPVSYCDFGSYIKYCVFDNSETYTPSVKKMEWCIFEGGICRIKNIPCCQRITFQKALNLETLDLYTLDPENVILIDGRKMSDVLTSIHDEHLFVYRVGNKYGIYKNSEEKIKSITPIFSNPYLNDIVVDENNCFGYVGDLSNLNVIGDNILIDSIGVYVENKEKSPNLDKPVWCRLLKFDGDTNTWEIVSQSETCKVIGEIKSENLFSFKMVNKSSNPLLKYNDKIAIVYVESEDSDILSSVELKFKYISKPGGLTSKMEIVNEYEEWSPAFVFGYMSMGSEISEVSLGNFENIEEVSSKAAEIKYLSNNHITKLSFRIDNENGSGFIEQFMLEKSDSETQTFVTVIQTLYFNGEIKSRQIVYNSDNGIIDVGEWNKIIEYNNNPILYSKNSEVVDLNSDQTITGNKVFENGVNFNGKIIVKNGIDLNGKTIIKSGDNDGELKVFGSSDDGVDFTIRTNGFFDENKEKPRLELLTTKNGTSYIYQFPQLESTKNTGIFALQDSDDINLDELINEVKENEKITAIALNYINETIDNINNNKISNVIVDITYAYLVKLRNENRLIPGMQYKIIDYITTTTQENTESANHKFDVIVTADSGNTLNEVARACLNDSDTYFKDNGAKLEAWQIWYCLDNDIDRFAWADSNNGKGVIYRMIDEWGNDCPYDFKNIKFKRTLFKDGDGLSDSNASAYIEEKYLYTFSWQKSDKSIIDSSIYGNNGNLKSNDGVYDNIIRKYIKGNDSKKTIQYLNDNVFISKSNNFNGCYSNNLGNNCYSNNFGHECNYNNLGNNCYSNNFDNGCCSNNLGNNCYSNNFESGCYSNILGDNCFLNILTNNCRYNIFGIMCRNNELTQLCVGNTFGLNCYNNKFNNTCGYNTIDNCCSNIDVAYVSYRNFKKDN